jgi:diketogulonate reductase-like aldo/keto reductase
MYEAPARERSGHCCDHCSNSSGRLGLRRPDLVSIHFTRRSVLMYEAPARERSGHCCDHCSNSSGRLGLRRPDLVSIHFTRRSSPGPRRDDLRNYWAHGPFVRSFILLVDPGDIRPPQICVAVSILNAYVLHKFRIAATVMQLDS